jgi:hypothetical protein
MAQDRSQTARTWSHYDVRPVQFTAITPQTGTSPTLHRNLTLPALKKRRELSNRIGELLPASCLTLRILRLQKAIECGDKRARDVICLYTHESAGVGIRSWGQ